MRINACKTKVSALTPGVQHQAVLLGDESLKHADMFTCICSMFTANGKDFKVKSLSCPFCILSPAVLSLAALCNM